MGRIKIGALFMVEGYGVVVAGGASGIGPGDTEALASNRARVTMLDVAFANAGIDGGSSLGQAD